MNSIPNDLFLEIFSRLTAKSVERCCCVSKQSPFLVHVSYTSSKDLMASLVLAADSHMKLSEDMRLTFCGYAAGLICFLRMPISNNEEDLMHVICNPSTGQCVSLPKLTKSICSNSFLGFDPIDKQFKVLSMATLDYNDDLDYDDDHTILTLETGKMNSICINGILYYFSRIRRPPYQIIVCFDVKSEKYKFIEADVFDAKLINYKGKLGGIAWHAIKLRMFVLEDAEKQEFLEYVYTFQSNYLFNPYNKVSIDVAGVTATGEIVLSMSNTNRLFYVFYFSPERNTLQSVEIQGFDEDMFYNSWNEVYAFVNHVEDLKFNITKITCCNFYMPTRREA
ncbi:hypothetical protein EUTSA_v10009454mg [Eutrema salsugineum]|uniref:F-box associated beta-propeller type 3 domain-containing protein n=1 Tax=Eutrema salsugineum TaxID=72664 RepID=V4MPK8_EUTSA|nr:hypothetical protein EUTSA_v10009454mg [Eutrema salsugineum]